ncbi:MAG: diguanylate cyclase, partial [Candidatus Thiodiazotropha sp.]
QDTGGEQALTIAERLRSTIAGTAAKQLDGLTCSFGVTCYQEWDQEASLVKRADDALYRAKAAGRNRVIVCGCDGAGDSNNSLITHHTRP